jgi:hypothetical protein
MGMVRLIIDLHELFGDEILQGKSRKGGFGSEVLQVAGKSLKPAAVRLANPRVTYVMEITNRVNCACSFFRLTSMSRTTRLSTYYST